MRNVHAAPSAPNKRGRLLAVRNEATPTVPELIQQVTRQFETFKTRHDTRLDAFGAKVAALHADVAALNEGAAHRMIMPVTPGARRISANAREEFLAVLRTGVGAINPRAATGGSIGSDPDGGWSVTPEIADGIAPAIRNESDIRRIALNATLSPGFGSWTKLITLRGAQTGWAGSSSVRSQTDVPSLGRVEHTPKELYAYPTLENHLLSDGAFDLEAFLNDDVAGEFGAAENAAFCNGTGANAQPRGVLQHPTATTGDSTRPFGTYQHIVTGAAGAFNPAVSPSANPADVLIDLVSATKATYRRNAKWLMHPTTLAVIRKFKDNDGRYIVVDSLQDGNPPRLLGYEVVEAEDVPQIDTDALAIAFGDFQRGYVVVDRPGMTLIVDRVTQVGFTKMYFARRTTGGALDTNAIKFLKFSAA